jgi:hypothetical protein
MHPVEPIDVPSQREPDGQHPGEAAAEEPAWRTPDPAPPAPSSVLPDAPLRGRVIATARLIPAVPFIARPQPAAVGELVETVTEPAPEPVAAEPPLPDTARAAYVDDDAPSAIGRLVAVIVTLGLSWALVVAITIWLLVLVFSKR